MARLVRPIFHPIRLRAGYFGLTRDIAVSPNQKLVLRGSDVEYMFGREAVLVPARHLLNNIAARWAEKRGIPWVFTPNGTLPRQERKIGAKLLWDALIANPIPKGAAACVAVSRAEVGQMVRGGIAKERIVEIPNGLMLEALKDHTKNETLTRSFISL